MENDAEPNHALAIADAETKSFELVQRQAKMLASSTLVPKDFINNIPNCAIALNVSKRTGLDPLMVAQNLAIIHGRPSWSATALIGMINSCGRYTPLRFVFDDEDAPTSCYAIATDKASGQSLRGEKITLTMAKAEGWSTKNGSKWLTMPGQMLRYRAASFWSRAYASDISLGLYCQDEIKDFAEPPRNVTPVSPITCGAITHITPITPIEEPTDVFEAEIVDGLEETPEAQKEATTKSKASPGKSLADLIETME